MKAIYPGSFDPFTNGHLDIANRAAKLVDHLMIAVSAHEHKKCLFTAAERCQLITDSIKEQRPELSDKVTVISFNVLLVNFVREHQCDIVFRGLRATTDFEYEFQMASINRNLDSTVDTVFLTASDKYHFVSSTMVKEISSLDGDLQNYVAPCVNLALKNKFSQQ